MLGLREKLSQATAPQGYRTYLDGLENVRGAESGEPFVVHVVERQYLVAERDVLREKRDKPGFFLSRREETRLKYLEGVINW